jgi:hypothetical protein
MLIGYWIAGVDYDENIQQEDGNNEACNEEDNKDPEDPEEDIEDDQYDWIYEDKVEDLNEDAREEDNFNQHQDQGKIEHDTQDKEESRDKGRAVISEPESDSQTSEVRRSTRKSQPVARLNQTWVASCTCRTTRRKENYHLPKMNWDNWNAATIW